MRFSKTLFLAFLFIYSPAFAESYVYVSDYVDIPMRLEGKIQNNPSNIIRMFPSGTQLQVLSRENGWTKVKFEKTIGWMISSYLTPALPAKVRLEKLKQTYNTDKLLINEQKKTNQELEKTQKQLKQDIEQSLIEIGKQKSEKQHIEQVYQDALKLEHTNEKLNTQVLHLKSEIQLLKSNNASNQDTSARNWFIAGALVLLFGFFIGFIFSKRSSQNHRRF